MKWIIQGKIFGAETSQLAKHLSDYEICELPKRGDIVRGSIPFVLESGGRWLTLDNYRCSKYYHHFDNLLNEDAEIMTWAELKNYDPADDMFVRPDSGEKLFTGTTIKKKWWRKEIEIIESTPWNRIDSETLVLVSPKREITKECRGLFYGSLLVSCSVYEGGPDGSEAATLSRIGARNRYYPDALYTMDIAWSGGEAYVLELNSFVSAGLYDMDMGDVVRVAEYLVKCEGSTGSIGNESKPLPSSCAAKLAEIGEWVVRSREWLDRAKYEMDYGSFAMAKNMVNEIEEIVK